MMRRRRLRWFAKWAGVVVCTLMGVVWLAATRFEFVIGDRSGSSVRLARGVADVTWRAWQQLSMPPGVDFWDMQVVGPIEWQMFEGYPGRGTWEILTFPLWLPFLTLALPTALLWWLDRRRIPANHCRTCGYDLTGNVSGVCPECGKGIA